MTFTLSKQLQTIKPSATLVMAAKAASLRAQGKNIINLAMGEPDFDTPNHIKEAALQAVKSGFTKYTPVDGIPELKKAIQQKFIKDNQLKYELDQIMVSAGAKQCVYNVLYTLLNPGDEVIIPAPYWVSYPDIVKLAGGVPVFISTDIKHQFKITASQLASCITTKTKAIIFNSPSNPTGIAYSAQELKTFTEVLKKHPHVVIITDDIYDKILWNNTPFHNLLMVEPALYDRTVVINGVSKTYAMTGWRIGYAAGPKLIIDGMKKIQSQCTSNPNSIAQKAAVAALNETQEPVKQMETEFKNRHDMVITKLKAIPGIQVIPSDGTFYSFPNVSGVMKRLSIPSDIALSERLLEEAELAVVPGTEFGAPNHIRLSYAASEQTLNMALERLHNFCK